MKLSKRILLPIALLFGTLIVDIEIASGQSIIQDSCICYTDNQDKRANECLVNQIKKDTIIKNHQREIKHFEIQISEFESQKQINEQRVKELGETLSKTKKRLNFSLTLNKYGIPIALGGGFVIGLIIK